MLQSDYKNCHRTSDLATAEAHSIVVCEGYFVREQERFDFVRRNFQESSIDCLCKQRQCLYESVGFPFDDVEAVLASTARTDFLYVLLRSPLNLEYLIYDEYVFKNFPLVVALFKKMRKGGDIIVYKKANEDLLFVKIHDIYEGPELLHMCL